MIFPGFHQMAASHIFLMEQNFHSHPKRLDFRVIFETPLRQIIPWALGVILVAGAGLSLCTALLNVRKRGLEG
jgi:hypothetical protein